MKLEYIRHGSGINATYEETRIQRAVIGLSGDVIAMEAKGITPSRAGFRGSGGRPREISLAVSSAGKRKVAPIGFEQAVPGMLVMFAMLVMLNVGGVTILTERRLGILRRLASAPMSARRWCWKMGRARVAGHGPDHRCDGHRNADI